MSIKIILEVTQPDGYIQTHVIGSIKAKGDAMNAVYGLNINSPANYKYYVQSEDEPYEKLKAERDELLEAVLMLQKFDTVVTGSIEWIELAEAHHNKVNHLIEKYGNS